MDIEDEEMRADEKRTVNMKNPCIRYECVRCCLETEMLLTKEDIERIKELGFDYRYFVIDIGGYFQLKNYGGRCVFNDGKKCLIYKNRPEGCKLYPIVYDEDKNLITLDEDCPRRNEFRISKYDKRRILKLINKIKHRE